MALEEKKFASVAIKQLRKTVSGDPQASELLEQLLDVRNAMAHTRATQLQLIRNEQLEEALQLSSGVQLERFEAIHALGLQLAMLTEQRVGETLEASRQSLETLRERIRNLSLLLVAVSAVLAWLLSRHIALPLARLTGLAEQEVRRQAITRIAAIPHRYAVDPDPVGERVDAERIGAPQHDVGHLAGFQTAGAVGNAQRLRRVIGQPANGITITQRNSGAAA